MKKFAVIILAISQTLALSATSYVPKEGEIRTTVYQTTEDRPLREILTTPFTKQYYAHKAIETIDLDDARADHEYMGCGVSLSDASCWLLSGMGRKARKQFYRQVFSKEGANLSMLRLNCGSSDYATEVYNYDDVEGDVGMKHFSIKRDELYMIPMIKEVLAYRPDAYLFSAVWSVPGWMKDNGLMIGGHQLDEYLPAVANYWAAYLKAYKDKGIDIRAISAQNEPETDQDNGAPTTLLSAEQESRLITEFFPAVFKKNNLDTKVWLLDHTYNHYQRVLNQLEDPLVKKGIDAIAWHPYEGIPDNAREVHVRYPEITMHLTERGPNAAMSQIQTCGYWCDVIFNALNAGCSSYSSWNLLLDENGAPNTGKSPCAGLFTLDSVTGELTSSTQYQVFCQFSPYVERGAKILSIDKPKGSWLRTIVFQNPNGDYVVVVSNDGSCKSSERVRVQIKFKDQYLHLPLPIKTWSMTTVIIKNS